MDTSRLPFTRTLRRLGFVRDGQFKDPLIYTKIEGDRKLDLQLWKDGAHRVSHWINGRTRFGRMCTYPTEFKTVDEMLAAIENERTRTDHPPATA